MSLLAAKHRRQAAEYEQQKQYDRAIAAYAAAIQESDAAREEIDVALFNRVGDLALRQGRIPEAMTYYERAVEQYLAGGRLNNAIALCNKILRTSPGRTAVYFTLGRISARKGLRNDASRNFLEFATRMQEEGRHQEARRALGEVAALFPDITEVQRLVEELGGVGPGEAESTRTTSTPAVASATLPPGFPHRPGGPGGASADGLVFLDVDYRGPGGAGEDPPIVQVPTPISSPAVAERSRPAVPESIGGSLDEHLLFDPAIGHSIPSPRTRAEAHGGTERGALPSLPAAGEGEVPGADGDPDDATPARVAGGGEPVEHLVEDAAWVLPALVVPLEGIETDLRVADVPSASLDELLVEESLADALDPLHGVPPVVSRVPTPRDLAIPGMAQALAEGERLVAAAEARSVESVLAAAEATLVPPPPFRINPHDFILPGELPPLLLQDDVVDAALGRQASLHLGEGDRDPGQTEPLPTPTASAPVEAQWSEVRSALAQWEEAALRSPADWGVRRRLAEARLEAGDQEGGVAALEEALQGLLAARHLDQAAEVAEVLVRVSPDRIASHQRRLEVALHRGDRDRLRTAYLDLADVLTRLGDDVAARAVHARVRDLAADEPRAHAASGGAVAASPSSPPAAGQATRIRVEEPETTGDDTVDFEILLRRFKDGVARSLGDDDYGSRYDLGVAYKEMGLLDDAVTEFQKALRSPPHRLPAYEALGQCFVEQGRHQVAITLLSRALSDPALDGQDDQHRIGVLYLLAYANEALQRREEALTHYHRVHQIDRSFRDVAARLAALGRGPS